jgi:hypothetical protein
MKLKYAYMMFEVETTGMYHTSLHDLQIYCSKRLIVSQTAYVNYSFW